MSDHAHNIKDEIKKYYKVFAALMALTVLTVAVAGLKVGVAVAVTLALIIATIKASLVASIFMHLIAEKKAIYVLMGFTMFFFASMIGLIIHGRYSVPERTYHTHFSSEEIDRQARIHTPHGTSHDAGADHESMPAQAHEESNEAAGGHH